MHTPNPNVIHPATKVSDTRSDRFADGIARAFGSMRMFYVLIGWQIIWMLLSWLGLPFFKTDPYPFVFLLFLGNLVQLWALPVLGVATNRADEKREAKATADHLALTHVANQVDAILARLEPAVAPAPVEPAAPPRRGRTRKPE